MSIYLENDYERGFGTYPLKGRELEQAILAAVETGYRAFDSAQMYGNEADTGAALRATGLDRGKLCITTKVAPENFDPARFLPSVEQSLRDLEIDFCDVLLLHWPPADSEIARPLELLQEAHARGLTRHIGVSNFTARMMRDARAQLDVPLACNQVEFHPLLDQSILLETARETGVPLASYCSVARGEVFKYPLFGKIGQKHGKSAAQVVLRWILQKGVTLNTMSTKPENIAANFDVMDFALSTGEMGKLDELKQTGYRIVTKDVVPGAPDFD